MRSRFFFPTVVALLLVCSMIATTQAVKPLEKYVDVEHFEEDGFKGIMKITLIIKSVEDGYATVSATALISGVNPTKGTMKVTISYTGTTDLSGGGMFGTPYTGILRYSLVSTGEADDVFGDGRWVIWYEEGEVVREIGSGNLWFP